MVLSHAADLQLEGSSYAGILITAILYGFNLGAYHLSTYALLARASIARFQRIFYILFGGIMLLLNTIFFLSTPLFGQMMWINHRNMYPGGPVQYYGLWINSSSFMILGNTAQTVSMALSDGLLIYRCYVVFGSRLYIVALPALCAFGTFALSTTSIAGAKIQNHNHILGKITSAGIVLNTTTNIMVTVMISYKILSVLYRVRRTAEVDPQLTRTYTNIVAILVESAAPCAILGILASVLELTFSYGKVGYWMEAVFMIWMGSVALFPQLIIFRIAYGTSWTRLTSEKLTHTGETLVFATPRTRLDDSSMSGLQSSGDATYEMTKYA